MKIITLTLNPAIDITIEIDQLVAERKLRSSRGVYEAGGGGINVAKVIHEMGNSAIAIFAAGGAPGKMLRDLLAEKGLDLECIEIAGRTREDITIVEKSSGQLYRLVMGGAEMTQFEQDECLDKLRSLGRADYTVISGSLPPGVGSGFYRQVISEMNEKGTRVILDTKALTLKEAVGEGVFLIKPNLHELQELAGRELNEESQQESAARELVSGGKADVVVVSLGAGGVYLVSKDLSERIRAPSVSIKSRVGAGDSMVAGITLGLSQGKSVRQSVILGIATGSAAVMTSGTELCRREDVERLFNELK